LTDNAEAAKAYNKVSSLLDRLARKGTISKNKAANLKSALALHVNKLANA
jgi:small subunit ribosomal protein S20